MIDYLRIAERIIHREAERAARENSRPLPKAQTKFIPPREAEYTPYGYHALFCSHDKCFAEPCSACKRDAQSAGEWTKRFLKNPE